MSLFGLSGTRWITHKLNALQLMLDKFGIYLQHLQSMSEDKSFKSADRQKFKGWLRKWQQARTPLLACLFLDILSPAKMLSLAFQENVINPVSTIQRLETAKKQLDRLEGKVCWNSGMTWWLTRYDNWMDPSRTHYLRVWKRIFTSSRKEEWNMVLLLVELLLSIPISNAKVERMFSLMNRVKTDSRAALSEHTLKNLIRIRMEGPPLEEFDPTPAIQL